MEKSQKVIISQNLSNKTFVLQDDNTGDSWTIQVRTVWVQLDTDFFFFYKYTTVL